MAESAIFSQMPVTLQGEEGLLILSVFLPFTVLLPLSQLEKSPSAEMLFGLFYLSGVVFGNWVKWLCSHLGSTLCRAGLISSTLQR